MQTQIIIFLFILNVFCLIGLVMLNTWNREQDEDLIDYGIVSNQQYEKLYAKFITERDMLLEIIKNNEHKTEVLIDSIINSIPQKQFDLIQFYRQKKKLINFKSEVDKRLTRKIHLGHFDLGKEKLFEQESLYAYRDKLEKGISQVESEITKLKKEINA